MNEQILLIVFGLLLGAEVLRSHRVLGRSLKQQNNPPRLKDYPSVTVIRPIKGLDAGAAENLKAALDHGYPGKVETLFVFDDRSEPVLDLARQAIQQNSKADARIIFSGQPPPGRTGKLNAMIEGLKEARRELIAFADSDIRPDRHALRRLVETLLEKPETGSAFAPVVVTESPRTVGDAGYALLLNAMYGPHAAQTAQKNGGELPFIMGQFMVFTREAIRKIGGLESAQGQLVDDMYLGMRLRAAGLHNRVSPHYVPIIQEGVGLKQFWSIFVRWIAFSRSGLPSRDFKLSTWSRGAIYWVGLILSAVTAAAGWWPAALVLSLAPVGISLSNNRLHRAIGGSKLTGKHSWASFALLLIAPFVYLSILLKHQVDWRGRSYRLGSDSRLAAGEAIPPDQACPENFLVAIGEASSTDKHRPGPAYRRAA